MERTLMLWETNLRSKFPHKYLVWPFSSNNCFQILISGLFVSGSLPSGGLPSSKYFLANCLQCLCSNFLDLVGYFDILQSYFVLIQSTWIWLQWSAKIKMHVSKFFYHEWYVLISFFCNSISEESTDTHKMLEHFKKIITAQVFWKTQKNLKLTST